ncbi:MAG: hypothetical protein H7061_14580 [Bdellovibrionaceae bacterium]|nr:hypothetical protein [Bdellovibrio sp.]
MSKYSNLIVVDLSSYGSALALINEFSDDEGVKVFEVSPMGTGALLILMTQEVTAAQILKNQIQTQMNPSVLSCCLIEDAHDDLLKTYLSQSQTKVGKNIMIIESTFVSEALSLANKLLANSIQLLDLRIVRTFPSNTIITATADHSEKLMTAVQKHNQLKYTLITNPQTVLKSYFEVVTIK